MANPQGYLPLVQDATPIRGILVVARDSPIRSPADLDGKVVAFPAPNAGETERFANNAAELAMRSEKSVKAAADQVRTVSIPRQSRGL